MLLVGLGVELNSNNFKNKMKALQYISLIAINFLYSCVALFTKYASQQEFMSWNYMLGVIGAVGVMGLYAILWQQVLKRIELSVAYMFKGTSIVFIMLLAYALFGEQITWNNIIGAIIIIVGIVLFAYNPKSSPLTSNLSPLN